MVSRPSAGGFLALAALGLLCSCAGTRSGEGGGGSAPPEDPVAAVEAAQAAVAANPKDPDALFELGFAWQRRADTSPAGIVQAAYRDSARIAYEQLLEVDPESVRGLVHAGLILEDLGRAEKALENYDRAIALAPDDPLPLINKGSLLYFQFKRTYEAKVALTKALELDPDNANAHFNLGVLFADANLFREAQREWEQVLELAPEGDPARALARDGLDRIAPLMEPGGGSGVGQ
jgi:tetratricopeptide (TPR) repeat protein